MPKRVVLAYSGGLDTSVAVKWIAEEWGCEVVALSVDVGQTADDDWDTIRDRALAAGAVEAVVVDAKREFADDYVAPVIRANALYEGKYPLVSALSRPVIARHLVRAAREFNADAVAHGCTGKGNDQVRFEVSVRALAPDLDVLAPVRVWGFTREDSIDYAARHDIPIKVRKDSPFSIDENLWGRAIECGVLEDPWAAPPVEIYALTDNPDGARARPVGAGRGLRAGRPRLARRRGDAARRARPRDDRAGRSLRLGPGRHGREPARRHQEPRELRVPGRARAAARARRPRVDHARARSHAREGEARAALRGARVRRPVVLAAARGARRVHGQLAAARHRRGAAAPRTRAAARSSGRRAEHGLYSHDLATYDASDTFRHQDAEGFVRLWGLSVETWAREQGGPEVR